MKIGLKLLIASILAIAACGHPQSSIEDGELTHAETLELRSAVEHGHIRREGRAATLDEAVAMYKETLRIERAAATPGAAARREYGAMQVVPSGSATQARLVLSNGIDDEARDRAARSLAARLRNQAPAALTPNPSVPDIARATSTRSAPLQVGVLYHDGTVTSPARAIHGTSGDAVLRFSFTPSALPASQGGYQQVTANLRLGGAEVGVLAVPPGGWRTPLTGKVYNVTRSGLISSSGRMVVLDTQTQPVEFGTTGVWRDAKLYVYAYSFSPSAGFQSSILHTVTLPAAPAVVPSPANPVPWQIGGGVVFAGSIALLDVAATEGAHIAGWPNVVVTDNFNGIYCATNGLTSFSLCALDSRMAGGVRAGVIQGIGPDGAYDVITPPPPGSPPSFAGVVGIYPGAHSVTSVVARDASGLRHDKICWSVSWSNHPDGSPDTAAMGLHCIGRSDLLNAAIPPFAKTGDPAFGGVSAPSYQLVVPGTAGLGDLTDALDNDRFNAPSMLYWMRAPSDASNVGCAFYSALRRINLDNGVIELVKCDREYFAWTNEISSAPSITGFRVTNILPSVGQEYNNSNLNMLVALGLRPEIYFASRMPTVIAPTATIFP